MELKALQARTMAFLLGHPSNRVTDEDAMRQDLVGMQMYDAPLFAVGDAADPLFEALRGETVTHPEYALPGDWVTGARSVVSFFLPFTERVKASNAADMRRVSDEWLHARIEGQAMLKLVHDFVMDALRAEGFAAVAPMLDARFRMLAPYCSNWSERHTAFVCGLGTFGLSKGLITEKGVAGRFGSVVTDCPITPTLRAYSGVYDYCTRCGQCAANCPVRCIDPARGEDGAKAHPPCSKYLQAMERLPVRGKSQKKRYGCGKCQVATPCQDGIPTRTSGIG